MLGGLGPDRLHGGGGDDWVDATEGQDPLGAGLTLPALLADPVVDCGPGEDVYFADPIDSPTGCEHTG